MLSHHLTAGEFARLARTTKRTILWYDQQKILKPSYIDLENGYRYYQPSQIIDFQAILLLRRLNFSLPEIKSYLATNRSLHKLFADKHRLLSLEIDRLKADLSTANSYYKNLKTNGTLVSPKLKTIQPFTIYYLEKTGPYSQIGEYLSELRSHFRSLPKTTPLLTIFEQFGYRPKKARMKIGLVKSASTHLKPRSKDKVQLFSLPKFKALSHTHTGTSKLLSLLWQELDKYRKKQGYSANKSLGFEDLELYHFVGQSASPDNEGYFVQILLPVN